MAPLRVVLVWLRRFLRPCGAPRRQPAGSACGS